MTLAIEAKRATIAPDMRAAGAQESLFEGIVHDDGGGGVMSPKTGHNTMTRPLTMATWRNGSAFGFDRQRHQKVAGSSPAVVMLFAFVFA